MPPDLPPEIQFELTARGARYILPPHERESQSVSALGLGVACVLCAIMLGSGLMAGGHDTTGWTFWAILAVGVVLCLSIGALNIHFALACMARGRDIVEIEPGWIRVSSRVAGLRSYRQRALNDVQRLWIVEAVEAEKALDPLTHLEYAQRGRLMAVGENIRPMDLLTALATMTTHLPRTSLRPLALHMAEFIERFQSVGHAEVVVEEQKHKLPAEATGTAPRPARSDATIHRDKHGMTIDLPMLGYGGSRWAIANTFYGMVVLVTGAVGLGVGTVVVSGLPERIIVGCISAGAAILGGVLIIHALLMAHRQARIDIRDGRLTITHQMLSYTGKRSWLTEHIQMIAVYGTVADETRKLVIASVTQKPARLFYERPADELYWLASEMRKAIELDNSEVFRQ
jgi:hypothetical protein